MELEGVRVRMHMYSIEHSGETNRPVQCMIAKPTQICRLVLSPGDFLVSGIRVILDEASGSRDIFREN